MCGGRCEGTDRGDGEFGHTGISKGLLHPGVGVKLPRLLAEDQIRADAPAREVPHTVRTLVAVGTGVEVLRAGVTGILQKSDQEEVILKSLGTKAEVLIEAANLLVVEINVEELVLP